MLLNEVCTAFVRICPEIAVGAATGRGGCPKMSGNVRKIAFQENRCFENLSGNFFMPDDSGILR